MAEKPSRSEVSYNAVWFAGMQSGEVRRLFNSPGELHKSVLKIALSTLRGRTVAVRSAIQRNSVPRNVK